MPNRAPEPQPGPVVETFPATHCPNCEILQEGIRLLKDQLALLDDQNRDLKNDLVVLANELRNARRTCKEEIHAEDY